jgi:hypothetical protein
VKDKLIVEFRKHPAGKAPTGETLSEPFLVVNYDFVLSKAVEAKNGKPALSEVGASSGAKS